MMKKVIYIGFLFTIHLFSHYSSVLGQGTMNIALGAGFPKMVHINPRFEIEQVKLGGSLGYFPVYGFIDVSTDLYIHFADSSELSNQYPWYFRGGLGYNRSSRHVGMYLSPGLGREFYQQKDFGFALEAGFLYQFYHFDIELNDDFNLDKKILPSLNLMVFYRF